MTTEVQCLLLWVIMIGQSLLISWLRLEVLMLRERADWLERNTLKKGGDWLPPSSRSDDYAP